MNKKAIILFGLFALTVSAMFSSCEVDDNDNVNSTLAKVMVINASQGTMFDFYIDNALQNANGIMYNRNTPYFQSLTGMKNLRLNNAATAVTVADINKDLDLNGDYSLVAIDTAGKTQVLFLEDDLSDPVLGKAHIRFIHASHNSGAIDIVNLADTSVVFSNQSFRQYTAFAPVDAGSYSLGYRVIGDSNIVSLPTPVNLANRGIYTIVASGYNTDTTGTTLTSLNIDLIRNN